MTQEWHGLFLSDLLVALVIFVVVFGVLWGVARTVTRWSFDNERVITIGIRLSGVLAGVAAVSIAVSSFGISTGEVPTLAAVGLAVYCLACLLYRQDRRELSEFYE